MPVLAKQAKNVCLVHLVVLGQEDPHPALPGQSLLRRRRARRALQGLLGEDGRQHPKELRFKDRLDKVKGAARPDHRENLCSTIGPDEENDLCPAPLKPLYLRSKVKSPPFL